MTLPPPLPARIAWLAPLLALLPLAGGCGGGGAEAAPAGARPAPREPDPIAVTVAPVRREPVAAMYSTSSTLRAEKRATVTARTRGVLEELFVEEGDAVSAGQTIAKLEDDEQVLAVARFENSLEIKQRELDRSAALNERRIISDNELEILRREAQELGHDLELAQLNLQRTTITSPFDGVVVLRHIDVGATVSDGTAIFDLADVDPLYVDVNVPERHVARLEPGQTVRLSADALDATVLARIERLAPMVDAGTGTVKVTVAVEGAVQLRPGAFVEVDVVTDVREDALVVPRSALVAEGRRWIVFRAKQDGESVQALEVRLGFEEGERVEIEDTVGDVKLAVGDLVVVLGASALSDGARVRVLAAGAESAPAGSGPP